MDKETKYIIYLLLKHVLNPSPFGTILSEPEWRVLMEYAKNPLMSNGNEHAGDRRTCYECHKVERTRKIKKIV